MKSEYFNILIEVTKVRMAHHGLLMKKLSEHKHGKIAAKHEEKYSQFRETLEWLEAEKKKYEE